MNTTYHLTSAQELNSDILEAIKLTYKSKAITITVEEEEDFKLTSEMKEVLDNRLLEPDEEYLSSENSIKKLNLKYGL
ncbi:hypothetical protein I5M32_07525 [Pedobacter sp. SD-b]|uniref:Addiction module component n=1 Tax=Pedobacter segetis TaxID=2793069 RepID=A0ABS1BIU1_9SPHI|nr:hypothetical protein [Pedobacter segetis]MBK0382807.1 hypothetical protein [Pedobacter segetis]